jgi:hypothetical protein
VKGTTASLAQSESGAVMHNGYFGTSPAREIAIEIKTGVNPQIVGHMDIIYERIYV